MLDRIHLRDLTVACIIGTNPEERVRRQQVVIDLTLECDLSRAARTDRLADTVDYRALKHRVVDLVEGSQFLLLEKLAAAIAAECLADGRIAAVRVCVDKPGALTRARSVAVELYRRRARRRG